VGVGTIIVDNPELTVRLVKGKKQPYKIIIDPHLRCPVNARIFKEGGKVILATTDESAKQKYPGSLIWIFKEKNGAIDVKEILKRAGKEGIISVMIEGGSKTFTHFIQAGVINKYLLFYSPSFIGKGVPLTSSPLKRVFLDATIKKIGKDILVESTNVYGNN
jgi:diaminohydroxyphosphoribosylaminopyrimidine deaminase/5-amino-6-(5-phosphoribosylamino)uracil reductase